MGVWFKSRPASIAAAQIRRRRRIWLPTCNVFSAIGAAPQPWLALASPSNYPRRALIAPQIHAPCTIKAHKYPRYPCVRGLIATIWPLYRQQLTVRTSFVHNCGRRLRLLGGLCVEHLLQDAADLLDGQLLPSNELLFVLVLGWSLDQRVGKLGWEQDCGLEPA